MKHLDRFAGWFCSALVAALGLFAGYYILRGLIWAFGIGVVIILLLCI